MINYELAKEIGATHYHNRTGEMYKVDLGALLVFRREIWIHSGLPLGEAVSKIKPIQPKRTRTEYEKVTESIFDLRDEFERGELYCKHEYAREYTQIINTQTLAQSLHGGYCFRKVEKEIDWREASHSYLSVKTGFHWSNPIAEVINDESDCFLELCRVALHARGEL